MHAQCQERAKDDFSRSQWRRHGKRRCRDCVLKAEALKDQAKLSKIKKIEAQRAVDLAKNPQPASGSGKTSPKKTAAVCNNQAILTSQEAIATCEQVLIALSQDITVHYAVCECVCECVRCITCEHVLLVVTQGITVNNVVRVCIHPVQALLGWQAFANDKRFRGIRSVIVPLLQWQVGASEAMHLHPLFASCIFFPGLLSLPTVFQR